MIRSVAKKFLKCQNGVSALEFIVFVPIFFICILGSVEISRYIMILQKIDKAAYTVGDLITRTEPNIIGKPILDRRLTRQNVEAEIGRYGELMAPYWDDSKGIIAVTSFTQNSDLSTPPNIDWSVIGGGNYTGTTKSEVSGRSIHHFDDVKGEPIQLLTTFQNIVNETGGFLEDENVVVVEVFYHFKPALSSGFFNFASRTIKKNAFFAPRYGSLHYLPNY